MTNSNMVKGVKIRKWLNENGFQLFVGNSKINHREYKVFKNDEFNAMLGVCEEITKDGNQEYWGALACEGVGEHFIIFGLDENCFIQRATNIFVKEYDLQVEFKGFKMKENIFDNDISFLEEIVNNVSEEYCIDDAINQVIDNFIPIYNYDLCQKAWELNEYVEDASINGLLGDTFNLFDALRYGAYEYYYQLAYENEQNIKEAYLVKYVKENPNKYLNIFGKSEAFSQCLECLGEAQNFEEIIDIFEEHYNDFILDME